MAFTVSNMVSTVFGNKRAVTLRVTTDAASDSIVTGLSVIDAIGGFCPQSMATNAPKFKINALSAGTSANGFLAITNATASDIYFITLYGH